MSYVSSCKNQSKSCVVLDISCTSSLWQAVIEAFIKDNVSRSLPNNFRRSVLREFLYKAQQGWDHMKSIVYYFIFLICISTKNH